MTSLTAKLTGGGGQTTEWVYGVSGAVASNDIVGAVKWPDPSTGASSSGQPEELASRITAKLRTALKEMEALTMELN